MQSSRSKTFKLLSFILGLTIAMFGTNFMAQGSKSKQISNAIDPVSYFINHVKQVAI
jgi:hypothetical protein